MVKCMYCSGDVSFGQIADLKIKDGILHITYSAYSCDSDIVQGEDETKINYCPFCGGNISNGRN